MCAHACVCACMCVCVCPQTQDCRSKGRRELCVCVCKREREELATCLVPEVWGGMQSRKGLRKEEEAEAAVTGAPRP